MTQSKRKATTLSTTVMFCLLFLGVASAQAQLTAYPGKIVCGFEPGNVPLLNNDNPFPHLYEKFKPGNYATSFNVLNLNATDQVVTFVLTALNQLPFTVATVPVNPFTSIEVGCDVFNAVPGAIGLRFEGMLVPVMANSNFIVDAVYTFESQNAFERHVVYEEDGATWTLGQTLKDILQDTFMPPNASSVAEAASGAGGLGLGASIDVERLDPVSIPPSMLDQTTDEFPLWNGEPLETDG